jgi:hypothetical protein
MQTISWNDAKSAYLRGEVSLRSLGERLGVCERTVFRRAKREKWTELKNRVQEKAQNLVEESSLATAAMLGADMAANALKGAAKAAQTANGFKVSMVSSLGNLAARLDQLAAEGASPMELRTMASALRDVWATGAEVHGFAENTKEPVVSVQVLAMLPDRAV